MFLDFLNDKRYKCSLLAALVFLGVSLPLTYRSTDRLIPSQGSTTYVGIGNCPTPVGKFLHTGIFFVILYFLMKYFDRSNLSNGLIAKYSFYATLLFFLISSEEAYSLTSQIPGMSDAVDDMYFDVGMVGCPTTKGVIIHAIVYLVILVMVMSFPKDN
jgi:hypothetical protein